MTASVWDYETVPYDDSQDWGDSQDGHQEASLVEEDDDGNGHVRKRGRAGRPVKSTKLNLPSSKKAAPVEDVLVLSGSDGCMSDDSGLGLGAALGSRRKPKASRVVDDADLGSSDEKGLLSPAGVPHAHGRTSHAAGPSGIAPAGVGTRAAGADMCEATRRAIEESRRLQQRMVALQGEEDVEEPHGAATSGTVLRRMALSLRRPGVPAAGDDDAGDGAGLSSLALGADGDGVGSDEAAAYACDGGGMPKLTIVCQCRCGNVSIAIKSTDPFSKLQRVFLRAAVDKGWLESASEVRGKAIRSAALRVCASSSVHAGDRTSVYRYCARAQWLC